MDALEHSSDDEGWAHLGTFGSYLTKVQSDFDPRMFGYKKLSELVKAKTDIFITQERPVLRNKPESVIHSRKVVA